MLTRDERIKLFATYLNTVASGVTVAGVFASAINVATSEHPAVFPVAYFAAGAFALSLILHALAQLVLGLL